MLSINAYDLAVLDRDISGPFGDASAKHIVGSGSGMPILMLTAADRVDDKVSGFELGADDYLTKPFALQELVRRDFRLRRPRRQGGVVRRGTSCSRHVRAGVTADHDRLRLRIVEDAYWSDVRRAIGTDGGQSAEKGLPQVLDFRVGETAQRLGLAMSFSPARSVEPAGGVLHRRKEQGHGLFAGTVAATTSTFVQSGGAREKCTGQAKRS